MSKKVKRIANSALEPLRQHEGKSAGQPARTAYSKSSLETFFMRIWELYRLDRAPDPESEYKFAPPRKWRADFAWPNQKLIVEVEGGKWLMGRHQTPEGFEGDCIKYNTAALLGYRILRYTGDMLYNDPKAVVDEIAAALGFGLLEEGID